MATLPTGLQKLIALLARLPGIGERTATRLAFHALSEPDGYATELARALDYVIEHVGFCEACHNIAEADLCPICSDPGRDGRTLCVVAGIPDLLAFERSGVYRGRYHVLHGVLAPLKGILPEQLRLQNLRPRIDEDEVKEVIVATPTGVEGEATALYLARHLSDLPVEVTRIATGVPMGGELEYVDPNTLGRALEGRTPLG